VHDADDQLPARLNRFGLIRAGENRIVLIVVVGVLVGVLALAAVLGYVVFHALSSTERTTVGAGEVGGSGRSGSCPGETPGHIWSAAGADREAAKGQLTGVGRSQ
jgi:hypothetical protein